MLALLVVDIDDKLLENYENFYVDYNLSAERKNAMVIEDLKHVEEQSLRLVPEHTLLIGFDKDIHVIGNCGPNEEELNELLGEKDD